MKRQKISNYLLMFLSCIIFVSCISVPVLDFEKDLINKGYTEASTAEYPTKIYNSFFENANASFKYPFVYEIKKTNKNYTAIYKYFFDECGDEMINKYVIITLINKNGLRKIYENENLNMDSKIVLKLNETITNEVTGETVTNPTLYLWD